MIMHTSIIKRYIQDLRKKFLYKRNEYGLSIIEGDKEKYDYFNLVNDIELLVKRFSFLIIKSAGQTESKRNLYYAKIGKGEKKIFYSGSHSGNDWLTSLMLMKFVEDLCICYEYNKSFSKVLVNDILNKYTFYIMPMVNPDGVELVVNGLKKDNVYYEQLLKWNNNSFDFSNWNANIRGVDLNYNYDIYWNKWKAKEPNIGIFKPGPQNYCGEMPESEAETKAIVNLINNEEFSMVVCYHREEKAVYYLKKQQSKFRNLKYLVSDKSVYSIGKKAISEHEGFIYSSFREWFRAEFGKPAITIGIEDDVEFISNSINFTKIYKQNIERLLSASLIV